MRLTLERTKVRPGGRAAGAAPPVRAAAPLARGGHHAPGSSVIDLAARGAGALARRVGALFAELRCRRERAAAIRELRAWDDRLLKDIGLTRGEIRAAVDGELVRGRPARRRGGGGGHG
jgi:uncharacterized protein YjiS (DUF1127 family)